LRSYELDPEKQVKCYNVRGTSIFLPTIAITNKWTAIWMRVTKKTVKWMKQAIVNIYTFTFKKLREEVEKQRVVEAAELQKVSEERGGGGGWGGARWGGVWEGESGSDACHNQTANHSRRSWRRRRRP
jgi:hypothetical protein